MKTVLKYEIKKSDMFFLVPKGAIPLHVDMQFGDLFVWCLVDTEQTEKQELTIYIRGTGDSVPSGNDVHYLGTFYENVFVFHAFWLEAI